MAGQAKLQSEAVADKAKMKDIEAKRDEADKKVLSLYNTVAAQTSICVLCCIDVCKVKLF